MSTIISAPTLPQVEGITRQDLIKALFRKTGIGEYGTATGGSVSTLVDTALINYGMHEKSLKGVIARIVKDAGGAGAAPEGDVRTIGGYAVATGTLTRETGSDFSAGVASGDEYEIWRNPHPTKVLNEIDRLLKEVIYAPCWTILTEIPDGDMEQNNTTDWTASNATLTKQTGEPAQYGKRYLRVVATAANAYARSGLIRVEPGKQYHLSAIARVSAASTTARLQAYDETNSASIDYKDSVRLYPNRIWFTFTAPATCYTISARLITVEDTKTTEWDEVCLYPIGAQDIRLPWWVKKKSQVLRVFDLIPSPIADNIWDWNLTGQHAPNWIVQDRYGGGGGLRVLNRNSGISNPLFIVGLRNEEAYANDYTEKKFIDNEYLVSCVVYHILDMLSGNYRAGTEDHTWITKLKDDANREYRKAMYTEMERIQQIFTDDTPMIQHLDSRFQFNV